VPRERFGAKAKVELVPDAATEQGKYGTTTVFAARINRRMPSSINGPVANCLCCAAPPATLAAGLMALGEGRGQTIALAEPV